MRYFNFRLFLILTLILSIVTFYSFNAAMSRDEGTLGHGAFQNFMANLYNVMRLPSHAILNRLLKSPFLFAAGLIVNCMLFSLVIERLVFLFMRFVVYRNHPSNDE